MGDIYQGVQSYISGFNTTPPPLPSAPIKLKYQEGSFPEAVFLERFPKRIPSNVSRETILLKLLC